MQIEEKNRGGGKMMVEAGECEKKYGKILNKMDVKC